MAEPTIQLGGGNWAGKSDNLLGYYKEGERFYKQDFTFSRSTTGTYTDKDGYIQEMPYNKLTYSNDFSNAAWVKSNTTETSGQSGYDGSNKAWLLEKSAANGLIRQFVDSEGDTTFSVYVKKGSLSWVRLFIASSTLSSSVYINLSNGVIGTKIGSPSVEVLDLGNGWYRCTISKNTTLINNFRIYPADGDNDTSGTSGSIYIQNAQVNKGSSTKTYFPTTTRLNMPRVDYLNNSNGSLILEPQRTNVFTESNDYTGWNGYQATSNTTISPDGSSVLFLDFEDVRMFPTTTISSGTEYTSSIYLKANKVADVKLRNARNEDTIISLTTDWVRYELTATSNATSTNALLIDARFSQGLGASGLEIALFGGQIEAGSYATSYIPTSGSSVTRNADVCNNGGDASRFNDNEGVLFFEGSALSDGTNQRWIAIGSGSNANRVSIHFNATNRISCSVRGSSSAIYDANFNIGSQTNNTKAAIKYKDSDYAFFVNGVKVDSQQSGSLSFNASLSELAFDSADGGSPFYGKTKQIQVYSTALSDTELATLTTL